jgi:hypothetical protein
VGVVSGRRGFAHCFRIFLFLFWAASRGGLLSRTRARGRRGDGGPHAAPRNVFLTTRPTFPVDDRTVCGNPEPGDHDRTGLSFPFLLAEHFLAGKKYLALFSR